MSRLSCFKLLVNESIPAELEGSTPEERYGTKIYEKLQDSEG